MTELRNKIFVYVKSELMFNVEASSKTIRLMFNAIN
jgi:hypothetical protein